MLPSYIVCDLETTGLDCARDEIIEIGLVRVEGGEVCDTFQSLVRPRHKLSAVIKRLTGLNDEVLTSAPAISEVLPGVMKFLGSKPLVGHNISFDRSFLEAVAGPMANLQYDTLELARIVFPQEQSHSLSELCLLLNIHNPSAHRALNDAMATAQLCQALGKRLKSIKVRTLTHLAGLLRVSGSPWAAPVSVLVREALQNVFTEKISDNTLFVPAPTLETIGEESVAQELLEVEKIKDIFASNGPLSAHLSGYEERQQQLKMARAVAEVLNLSGYLMAEAGTGTGKSMAYLVPAICYALQRGKRVLVATRTINLQEQLWEKDIPLLQRALPWQFKAAMVKGRQNYLCLRRWFSMLKAEDWQAAEALFLSRLLVWISETHTGDRTEINLNSFEMDLWTQVCADSEGCLGTHCRWYSRNCYVTRAKRAAETSQILITNHSLLLSDIRMENRVLPAYGPLIIDEAHHLEDAATEQLGRQVSLSQTRRLLFTLGRTLKRLMDLPAPTEVKVWTDTITKTKEVMAHFREGAEVFFNVLYAQLQGKVSHLSGEMGRGTVRLHPCAYNGPFEELIINAEYLNLISRFKAMEDCLKKLLELLADPQAENEMWDGYSRDLLQNINYTEEMLSDLNFIVSSGDNNYVYWAEVRFDADGACSLHAAPIHVGNILYEQLFKQKKTVIMTSATITVEESFAHFKDRTGLDLLPVMSDGGGSAVSLTEIRVESPFSYDEQSLLCLVRNMPGQSEVPEEAYYKALQENLTDLIETAGGKTLVLFTSHKVLREVYRRLKPVLEEKDICILGHNIDGGRTKLVNQFRSTDRAVLLGAASFWEGVDVPGEALSCVIIVKLPFWAPSIPVIEARLEEMDRKSKDSFRSFSLPQAVIRFKQGFGRLIRSERDRGVVVVLDGRLINKRYGKYFLNSLPLSNHVRGDTATVIREMKNWLNQ